MYAGLNRWTQYRRYRGDAVIAWPDFAHSYGFVFTDSPNTLTGCRRRLIRRRITVLMNAILGTPLTVVVRLQDAFSLCCYCSYCRPTDTTETCWLNAGSLATRLPQIRSRRARAVLLMAVKERDNRLIHHRRLVNWLLTGHTMIA